jgi:hypothetical protein
MNPELGLVVAASPENRQSYLSGWSNVFFKLVTPPKTLERDRGKEVRSG